MASGPSAEDASMTRDDQDEAFDELVEAHSADLHVHSYRMLGSL